jgi:hypothetical protein
VSVSFSVCPVTFHRFCVREHPNTTESQRRTVMDSHVGARPADASEDRSKRHGRPQLGSAEICCLSIGAVSATAQGRPSGLAQVKSEKRDHARPVGRQTVTPQPCPRGSFGLSLVTHLLSHVLSGKSGTSRGGVNQLGKVWARDCSQTRAASFHFCRFLYWGGLREKLFFRGGLQPDQAGGSEGPAVP